MPQPSGRGKTGLASNNLQTGTEVEFIRSCPLYRIPRKGTMAFNLLLMLSGQVNNGVMAELLSVSTSGLVTP